MLAMLLVGLGLGTAARAENPFCDAPTYFLRAPATAPDRDLTALLSPQERADPATAQRLLHEAKDGGHSELGFRYVARAFGYPGDFRDHAKVEEWLVEKELGDESYQGIRAVWEKWTEETETKLVAGEDQRELGLHSFFGGDRVKARQFSSCLATDVARSRCESWIHQKIYGEARVYYGRPTSRAPCAVHYNGGLVQNEKPKEVHYEVQNTSQFCNRDGSGCTSQTTTKKFEWQDPEQKGGGAPAGGAK